jgi:hypothetical protein
LNEAIDYIKSFPSKIIHSPLIQEEALYRIRNHPDAIQESLHHSIVRIPRNLAFILHRNPTCISAAIEAFYLRDPVALKPLQTTSPDSLRFSPTDLVLASVKFTKIGFAQLRSQEFPPPPAWEPFMEGSQNDQEAARAEIGMKLASGFEMLVADPQTQDKKVVREVNIILQDLKSGDDNLPTVAEISTWSQRNDDDGWLDINFNDFDAKLSGKSKEKNDGQGFGDKAAHERVQKMVEQFESFLNKSGSSSDDDDDDDEEDSEDEQDDSEDERVDVQFDEDEFETMMREMMGLPSRSATKAAEGSQPRPSDHLPNTEDAEIKNIMDEMQAELAATGVLDLQGHQSSAGNGDRAIGETGEADIDEELTIDFNLAKNLLQSYEAQAGLAGPAGNALGMMGVRLPPDDEQPAKNSK